MGSMWRTLGRRTLLDIALVCAADAVVGLTFGAVAVAGGLPVWLPIGLSVLVFAGGAQIAAVGVLLAGGGVAAAAGAGLVLNSRLLPYSMAMSDLLGERGWWTRLVGVHFVIDESVAFALRQDDPRRRRAAFWCTGLALFVCWNAAVALGALAAGAIGNTDRLGLDAVFPAVMLALVLPALSNDRKLREAALVGVLLAVAATPWLPAGIPLLLAPIGLVTALRRNPKQPAPEPDVTDEPDVAEFEQVAR